MQLLDSWGVLDLGKSCADRMPCTQGSHCAGLSPTHRLLWVWVCLHTHGGAQS